MLIYLLILLVVGVVAAMKFAKLAQSKGYQGAKARRYPLLLMIAAIGAAVILFLIVTVVGKSLPHVRSLAQSIFIVGNWFIIGVNLLILRKAYKNMQDAPDARQ
jgi:arginine exporter protein ArgO